MATAALRVPAFVTTDHELVFDAKSKLRADLAQRKLADTEVWCVIKRRRPARSLPANRYWWGCVLRVAAEALGYADPDELHDAIVTKFRPLPPDPVTGLTRRRRTSEMDTQEFSDLTSDVIQWLEADLHIRVPRPGEEEAA